MAKNLADELESLKKLSPEERIAKLKSLKGELEEEKKKNEQEIEKLTKQSEVEIVKKKESNDLGKLIRDNEEFAERAKKNESEGKAPHKEQYGQTLSELKDIQSQIYRLKGSDEWGKEQFNELYSAEKRLEKIEGTSVSSKYIADQLDMSRKVLNQLKLYRD